ncbi:DUF3772 domain-containing protein [Photobacterium rosenbergii]|uniref:Mechanosensitive ion channel n=1 Tax=Photobacterium rosenbergii TaxID=294936 RepID=A0ABU3ZMX5_9GAMM|nr:DUF3772 domain-containing protein [Photobacterium rosenbergii]MDV5171396.1 mechanosensitive ion channel [Photobacterium rosenbergii]
MYTIQLSPIQPRMYLLTVGMLLLALALLPRWASAADVNQQEPFRTWDQTAREAERLLRGESTTSGQLEVLRKALAEQREQAYKIATYQDVEVRTLEAQLDALGPPPKEGESEAPLKAQRREELEQSLANASRPSVYARGAYERINLLIGEIDSRIRENTAQRWLVKSPSPLSPARWTTASSELSSYFSSVNQELSRVLDDKEKKHHFVSVLPLSLALLILAVLNLTWLQPKVLEHLEGHIQHMASKGVSLLLSMSATFFYLLFPLLSMAAAVIAIRVLELRLASMHSTLSIWPALVGFLVISHWLGFLMFRPATPNKRIITCDDKQAALGLRFCLSLGGFLCLISLIGTFSLDFRFSPASIAVYTLPCILLGSLMMWSLARVLRKAIQQHPADQGEGQANTASKGVLGTLILLMKASSILSVIFVALGYDNLARQAIIPMVMSIGVIALAIVMYYGLLSVLFRFSTLSEEQKQNQPGLLPFILITLIGIAIIPLLALTWGARMTDIVEVWRLLSEGISLGEARLSLNVILTLFVVLLTGIVLTRWLQHVLRYSVLPKTRIDIGASTALVTGIGYIGYTLSALVAISAAGINLSSLAVVAGALSVGIGFGLQTIVSNFVSGIILLVERPIKEGDWIEVSGYSGFVKKVAVRSTRIETFDLHDVVIPNSDLIAGTVKNMTLHNSHGRLVVPVGVAYGSDLNTVKAVLTEAAVGHSRVLDYPEPMVIFTEMGDSALLFELRCFIDDVRQVFIIRSDLLFEIYEQLTARGVTIPFPQRDLHIKDLSGLAATPEQPKQAP